MKRIALTIVCCFLFCALTKAKGVIVRSHATHHFTEMQWFNGLSINCTAQTKNDTVSGSFHFRTDGIKSNDTKQFIRYGKIQRLVITRENGAIDTFDQMPDRRNFYKLVASQNDLALYNKILFTPRSKNLRYSSEYYFSNGKFSRPLMSDFRDNKLRKRVVTLLNEKLKSQITEDSTPEKVLLLFKQ